MKLQDRVALVTGAGLRLGRAMALDLAHRGAHVAVHYNRSEAEAREVVDQIEKLGRRALAIQADLSKVPEIASMFAQVDEAFGRLDVLINSAANFIRAPIAEIDEDAWDQSLDVNLKGACFCALEAARLMRRGDGGNIVNFTDWGGLRPYRNYLPYIVSKGGIVTLTQTLALELAPEIQVNAVAPGLILPPEGTTQEQIDRMARHIPLKRAGSPDDIVAAVAFLIEGSDYITGQILCVDGGRLIA